MLEKMYLSVIIPAFNEENRLAATLLATTEYLDELCPNRYELLIVDDGSTDATAAIAQNFHDKHPSARLVQYSANRGKGFAVRHGMLDACGEWRLFCDADLATPIEELGRLFDAVERNASDIAIGSRPLRESRLIVHQPWHREMLGRSFNRVVQLLAVRGIQDTQCGFKLFKASAAQNVFARCKLDGFAFDAEALYVAEKLGYRISEVPIRWSHKAGSKVSMVRDGTRMILDLLRIRRLHRMVNRAVVEPQI